MAELLTAQQLTKRFGNTLAVDEVSLVIESGRSVGVIGESGSGKSTLTKLLLGILAPDAGQVRFAGQQVTVGGYGRRPWRRAMQLVPQDPYSSLTGSMSVRQILAEPVWLLERRTLGSQEAGRLLADVGLDAGLLTRYPHQLSGGQRQRVAIARALSVNPQILVADEPVSALDVCVRAELLSLLERLTQERELTMIVVSHDLAVVQRLCAESIVMANGQVIESGPTLRLITAPQHRITAELIAAVPRLDQF